MYTINRCRAKAHVTLHSNRVRNIQTTRLAMLHLHPDMPVWIQRGFLLLCASRHTCNKHIYLIGILWTYKRICMLLYIKQHTHKQLLICWVLSRWVKSLIIAVMNGAPITTIIVIGVTIIIVIYDGHKDWPSLVLLPSIVTQETKWPSFFASLIVCWPWRVRTCWIACRIFDKR